MKHVVRFKHEVVDSLPESLRASTLYVTPEGDVAGHLCACGCGQEVITPLSPTDWSITFERQGASLYPSIGNWSFPCRSHYFIRGGAVVWASDMSDDEIAAGRHLDRLRKQSYYSDEVQPSVGNEPAVPLPPLSKGVWQRLLGWAKNFFVR